MFKYMDTQIGKRDLTQPNNWQPLNFNEYKITKPTIICLGGNVTKEVTDANAMCKLAASIIGLQPQFTNEHATYNDVDIVGVAYGYSRANSLLTKSPTSLNNLEIGMLVDTLLLPLATNEYGERLSLEQAQKNFVNVNFFSHCYGSKVINQMSYDLLCKMEDIGYSTKEFRTILKQITSVSYAPMEEVGQITSIQAFSKKDYSSMVPQYADRNFKEIYFNVLRNKVEFTGNYIFQEDENTVTLFTSSMTPDPVDEHCAILINRNDNWQYKEATSDHADEVSQVLGYTLASAVAVGLQNQHSTEFIPKPTPAEILACGEDILGSSQQDLGYHQ